MTVTVCVCTRFASTRGARAEPCVEAAHMRRNRHEPVEKLYNDDGCAGFYSNSIFMGHTHAFLPKQEICERVWGLCVSSNFGKISGTVSETTSV